MNADTVIEYASGHPIEITSQGRRELCCCTVHEGPCVLPDGRNIAYVRRQNTLNRAFNDGVRAMAHNLDYSRDDFYVNQTLRPIVDLPGGSNFEED